METFWPGQCRGRAVAVTKTDGTGLLVALPEPAYGEDMDTVNDKGKDPYAQENIDTGEVSPEQLKKWRDEGGASHTRPGQDEDPGTATN